MWVECVIAGLCISPEELQGEPGSWLAGVSSGCGLVECVIAVLCISAEELQGEPGSWGLRASVVGVGQLSVSVIVAHRGRMHVDTDGAKRVQIAPKRVQIAPKRVQIAPKRV